MHMCDEAGGPACTYEFKLDLAQSTTLNCSPFSVAECAKQEQQQQRCHREIRKSRFKDAT